MKKQIIILLTLYSFTYANNTTTEVEEKVMVLKVLNQYTQTVACSTNFEFEKQKPLEFFLKNIFTIQRNVEYGTTTYYALWSGDKGCFGGSGTNNFYVSTIYRDGGDKPFLVMNDEAFGKAFSKINSRFIDSIRKLDSSHFEVVASKYAKGDANCCPSLKYKYTLIKSKKRGEWEVGSKKRLK